MTWAACAVSNCRRVDLAVASVKLESDARQTGVAQRQATLTCHIPVYRESAISFTPGPTLPSVVIIASNGLLHEAFDRTWASCAVSNCRRVDLAVALVKLEGDARQIGVAQRRATLHCHIPVYRESAIPITPGPTRPSVVIIASNSLLHEAIDMTWAACAVSDCRRVDLAVALVKLEGDARPIGVAQRQATLHRHIPMYRESAIPIIIGPTRPSVVIIAGHIHHGTSHGRGQVIRPSVA
jgi:hypothetical protein